MERGGGGVGDGFGASAFQDIWLSGNYLSKDINGYLYIYNRGTAQVFCRFNPPNNSCCGNGYDVYCSWHLNYYKVNLLVAF